MCLALAGARFRQRFVLLGGGGQQRGDAPTSPVHLSSSRSAEVEISQSHPVRRRQEDLGRLSQEKALGREFSAAAAGAAAAAEHEREPER